MRVALLTLVAGCGRLGFDAGDGGAPADATRSSASYMGSVLFVEPFEDLNFTARGWYDGPGGLLSTTEHAPGSTASFECRWQIGGQSCLDGKPGRVLVPATDPLYASYWMKVSSGFAGLAGALNLM